MTSLKWHDAPQPSPAHAQMQSGNNPWFAISIGLLGFIIGAIASPLWSQGTLAQGTQPSIQDNPPQIAAAPKAGGCGCGGANGCGMAGAR